MRTWRGPLIEKLWNLHDGSPFLSSAFWVLLSFALNLLLLPVVAACPFVETMVYERLLGAYEQQRFEQRAADDKGCPAALPRDMCRAISLSTEAMADYIARKADVWAVEQQIHGAPEDVAYSDASVEQRRQRIFRNFMELVGEEIAKRHPDADRVPPPSRVGGLFTLPNCDQRHLPTYRDWLPQPANALNRQVCGLPVHLPTYPGL